MSPQKNLVSKIKKQLPFSERFVYCSLWCLKRHLNVMKDSISKCKGNESHMYHLDSCLGF